MSELPGPTDTRKAKVKELITRLHNGEDPDRIKDEFGNVIHGLTPLEIAAIEGEMIREGMPREEIHRLCDVHLAVMKDAINETPPELPEWHPIRILLAEHREFLMAATRLRNIGAALARAAGDSPETHAGGMSSTTVRDPDGFAIPWETVKEIENITGGFRHEELHYQREENVLFPYLERHGITEPPAIMWMDHDRIRGIKKDLRNLVDQRETMGPGEFALSLRETALTYHEALSSHFYKENNILFPSSVKVITDPEWDGIRESFDDIGYFFVTPPEHRPTREREGEGNAEGKRDLARDAEWGRTEARGGQDPHPPGWTPPPGEAEAGTPEDGRTIRFGSGSFSPRELEALLNTLPIDITFVDADDRVRYFSQGKERIFVRTKAILGREVVNCHPRKSVDTVIRIVEDFRSGARDSAEFWLELEGKFVYIRYFAVRDGSGTYLGTVEVSQDIAPIQRISGEKRLLD